MSMRIMFPSALMLVVLSWIGVATGDKALQKEAANHVVEIRNLQVKDNVISGEVINKSPHPIRDLELLVQYHWLWADEFKPGVESPGKAVIAKLDKEFPPGQSARFSVPVDPPPPVQAKGRYMMEVSIAGFSEIIRSNVG
jgi:hypothetical protein